MSEKTNLDKLEETAKDLEGSKHKNRSWGSYWIKETKKAIHKDFKKVKETYLNKPEVDLFFEEIENILKLEDAN